ncbi:MAG TPA: hypothetical protein VG269_09975 [Tepidisphaeraceae bacterium]|nr:hypothetical protein [Tepidisphaeraceae bacterium]
MRLLPRPLLVLLLLTGLFFTRRADACQVPVFRYALERWQPEIYEAIVFHRGPLGKQQRAMVDALAGGAAPSNLQAVDVDVAATLVGGAQTLWQAQGAVALPWVVVRYTGEEKSAPLWAGKLDSPELARLADSPARREIARHLLAGDSAMWVLLDGGDAPRDAAANGLLRGVLAKLEKSIELPLPDPNAGAGEAVLSDLPLRLAFPMVRISRSDPAEKLFITLLLHGDKELLASKNPVVVPVFGRGRALACLEGKDLSADRIEEAGVFLAGECSCQVKELNPGFDLLIAANWDAINQVPAGPATRPAPARPVAEPPIVASASLTPSADAQVDQADRERHHALVRRQRLFTAAVGIMCGVVLVLGYLTLQSRKKGRRTR